ncbi:glycosyltransferase family 2 protein [Algoriphagus halophytocola]|uniref:Glycosyltransferase family 2 protein n=1 Tax=Algoriphagus halophytocola TaxID=2991499 RepID=A0ABY6MF17_9BACT|nr:glycosyltransferase family 2 protein [Algoriphagus sp. TR-M5]UZD22407.1 glycosyltransferase family 2 protein [Algoriphagus sp. TR-M5]
MKSCAIVILNYNGEEMLKTFLPSVCAHSKFDIWVIDNASTDQSLEVLATDFPQVKCLQQVANLGFAAGYNEGLQELKDQYQYYILLNSDVEVTEGWDLDLINWMDKHPEYAAAQPKILSYPDKAQFDYAGAGGGFLDAYGYPYCRGRIWDHLEKDQGQYNDSIDVDWASGACMVVKSSVFHELSGFDPSFFAHMEEIDLCWRMRRSGWKIAYLGQVSVFHLGGGTLDRSSPRKLYLNVRNSLSMIYKNESVWAFRRIFLVKSMLEHLAAMNYVKDGKKAYSDAILNAYRDFRMQKKSMSKFVPVENDKPEVPRQGKVTLVFWDWRVRGKKTFGQL